MTRRWAFVLSRDGTRPGLDAVRRCRFLRRTEPWSHISGRVGANALPGAWVTSGMNKNHSPISITKVAGALVTVNEVANVVLGLVRVVVGVHGRWSGGRRRRGPPGGRRRRWRRIWVLLLLVVFAHVAVCLWLQCRRWQEKGVASADRFSGSGTSRVRLTKRDVPLDSPRSGELSKPILGLRNKIL